MNRHLKQVLAYFIILAITFVPFAICLLVLSGGVHGEVYSGPWFGVLLGLFWVIILLFPLLVIRLMKIGRKVPNLEEILAKLNITGSEDGKP